VVVDTEIVKEGCDMIIKTEPTKAKSVHHVCLFHKKNPGVPYAGCCCSSLYWNEVDYEAKAILDERKELVIRES